MRNLVASVALLCCTLVAWSQGEVHWLEREHDLGTFKEEDGKQSCVMRMVNTGDSSMVITRVQSTCGCTATGFTQGVIQPGDTALVTLTYNPANRPGAFEKDVYVYTTGMPRRSQLTIRGKVIGAVETVDNKYPVKAGGLRLEVESVPLGEMYRGATRNAYINTYNASRDTLVVTIQGNLPHVSLAAAPDTIAPGEAGAIVAHYDTRQAPLWGFNEDTLLVMAEPLHNSPTAIAGVARVYVMAQVMDKPQELTGKQLAKVPQLELSDDMVDFGAMSLQEKTYTRQLTLKNVGKSNLEVRRVWCPDKAIEIGNAPSVLKKGKSAGVQLQVDMSRVDNGMLNTWLTVMTNDPAIPTVKLRVVGYVVK